MNIKDMDDMDSFFNDCFSAIAYYFDSDDGLPEAKLKEVFSLAKQALADAEPKHDKDHVTIHISQLKMLEDQVKALTEYASKVELNRPIQVALQAEPKPSSGWPSEDELKKWHHDFCAKHGLLRMAAFDVYEWLTEKHTTEVARLKAIIGRASTRIYNLRNALNLEMSGNYDPDPYENCKDALKADDELAGGK
jgi:hypothetical protein